MTVDDILSAFTSRDDWRKFLNAQEAAFIPTPEEIAAQRAAERQNTLATAQGYLTLYGITIEGHTLEELITEYMKNDPDMKEIVGDDLDRGVNNWLATCYSDSDPLLKFCYLVIQTEQ